MNNKQTGEHMTQLDTIEALIASGITEREEMARLSGLPEKTVSYTLKNLVQAGRIELVRHRSRGQRIGKKQAIYKVLEQRAPSRRNKQFKPMVNSVFALGQI